MHEESDSKHKLEKFIELAFHSAQAITQIYFTYFLTFYWKEVASFLESACKCMQNCLDMKQVRDLNPVSVCWLLFS